MLRSTAALFSETGGRREVFYVMMLSFAKII